jgi:hypothetical protein
MIPTLRAIQRATRPAKGKTALHKTARQLPELRDRYRDIDALIRYERVLGEWAEDEADQRRRPIRNRIAALRAEQEDHLESIRDQCRQLGIDPVGDSLQDLDRAWPEVSEIAARRDRDLRVLGA